MANTAYKSVDAYIAAQPEAAQAALKRVRSIVRKAMPGAEEVISYQMPAYRLHGRVALYFGGWKEHYSLFPAGATGSVLAAFKDELAPYKLSKGTIRFGLSEPVPVKLIERIAKFRAREVAGREAAKAAGSKKKARRA